MQGVAGCRSVLQCVARCCSFVQFECGAVCCSVAGLEQAGAVQCVAVCCSVLKCVAAVWPGQGRQMWCIVLQCCAE